MTLPPRWWHRLDHYYFLTASLAARGIQTSCCRIVAAMIFGLGAISVALIPSSFGPRGLVDQSLAAAVTLCCWLMAALWWRRRWPTITESRACVVAGTACIAVACLIQSDPMAGLFGATAFGLVASYTALFHTIRLLTLCWSTAALTLAVLVARVGRHDAYFAICAALVIALIIGFVSCTGRVTIWMIDADIFDQNFEPLTGLPTLDGFYDKAATLLTAKSRNDDRYLVIAIVHLDGFSLLDSLHGTAGAQQARVDIAQRLRETARRDAILAHPKDPEFLLADVFPTPDAAALIDRVHGTIKSAPARLTASIGVVCTPLRPLIAHPPREVLEEIVAVAIHAMHQARKNGGNHVNYVHDPPLRVLDDPNHESADDTPTT